MQNTIINIVLFGIVILLFFSACQKEEFDFDTGRSLYIDPINPETEPDRLSQYLEIEGTFQQGDLPEGSLNANIVITNFQTSASVSNGSLLFIPFTFSSQQEIVAIYLQVIGAGSYWRIPVTRSTTGGNYVFGVGIPEAVLQGTFNFHYSIEGENGIISSPVTLQTNVTSLAVACENDQPYTESGSDGLTVRRITLGNTAGQVALSYQMYTLPDRLDILYNGRWVASTAETPLGINDLPPSSVCHDGTEGYVPGSGTLFFDFDPSESKEFVIYMSGCFGGTAWDLFLDCPGGCGQGTAPALFKETITLKANQKGPLKTYINVNKDDYVFISSKSKIVVDHSPVTGNMYTSAIGRSPIFLGHEYLRKYDNYLFGQVIIKVGNQTIPFENIDLKGLDCDSLPDDTIIDGWYFTGEFGNYFIAPESGILEFEINDADPTNNSGAFEIEVYKLSKDQHEARNCFNRCPKSKPEKDILTGQFDFIDHVGNEWDERGPLGGLLSDDKAECCYHDCNEDFRGESETVLGCQCVYDDNGNLINEEDLLNQGSFDYGYWLKEGDLKLHFIYDVFPHLMYLDKYSDFTYHPTPDSNIY